MTMGSNCPDGNLHPVLVPTYDQLREGSTVWGYKSRGVDDMRLANFCPKGVRRKVLDKAREKHHSEGISFCSCVDWLCFKLNMYVEK
jgi:hypothetical protein